MTRSSNAVDFDCLIIGAGVIGMSMAGLLLARGLAGRGRVAVIADRPGPVAAVGGADWDVRVFALSRASQRLLEVCGVWQALPRDRVHAYERMVVWDARGEPGGSGSLTFDCAELGEPNLGSIVEATALQVECARAANAAGVVLIEAGLERVVSGQGGVRIQLSDGRELRGHLLIAADGTASKTRGLLGIDTAGHTYGQDALVAHVRTSRPHRSTAWQRFLPTGPLAFLPLPDGRSSIVWSMASADAARVRALDAAAFGDALTRAGGDALGACELTTPVASFPLSLQYAVDYVRPRAVLLGDAAHVVHPLAGQGLNLGLLDCAVLADVLGQADAGTGVGAAFGEHKLLRRYERRRRSENLVATAALDALERLFGSDDPTLARLRAIGLGAVGRVAFARRALAERALGLNSDVPAFLRQTTVTRAGT
jgi:2-octaprenylphenol hydroxylase